jgi:hypothetical protein
MGALLVLILFYTCFVALFALAGSNRSIGYWGAFWVILLTTPTIGLVITLCSSRIKEEIIYKCKHCQYLTNSRNCYCPRCTKDTDGFTLEQNKERFK